MSSFTPINARQVEEKKRAQARQCYWCVVMKPLGEPCTDRDNPDEQCCCDDCEIKRSKEEESAVQAETEATSGADTEATSGAETEDTVKAETEDTVKAETEDTVKAETEDTVKAETEDTVKAETEDTVRAEHEAPSQAAAERPIVEERARGKASNKKTCSRCNGKEYNMSNFADHIKVHALEENGEMQLQWAQDGAA
ncbi:hypothetical protein FCIRC_10653 [Fusarium circinatum]|uniref:Uncharacterized protein n=1 Tax=Fusarium circinatum TaxID=48490 RepID=A0A8H5WMA5_FUSCI|nr:hypothetical protein FCIRC_10653 [Fusarium circinatum]